MTMALCFACGQIKFGAMIPCRACQAPGTGNPDLDIAFSDHNYDVRTLEEFGAVIAAINSATDDMPTRFWAFIAYVSEHHPSILKVELKPEVKPRVLGVLGQVVLPAVTLRRPAGFKEEKER